MNESTINLTNTSTNAYPIPNEGLPVFEKPIGLSEKPTAQSEKVAGAELPFVLDFSLDGAKERAEFITRMLSYKKKPLTARQLDLITTYLLYGKDEQDGKSPVQRKELTVTTRYGRQAHPTSSLDELLE